MESFINQNLLIMKTILSAIILSLFCNVLLAQSSELKYNLEKDKVYRVKASSVVDQKMTMQGQERNTETKSISYFSLKMLDAKPEFFIAEVKFDTITTIISMPPMTLTSAEPGDINSEDAVQVTNSILNRLCNSTLVVRMDYKGFVLDIMNHNVVEKTVLEGTDSLKGMAAMAKPQLVMMADKDALKGMIEGVTAYLPATEVAQGDKWESTFSNNMGGVGMLITSNYKLKELSKNKATLEGDVVMKPASTEPMMMNGAEITNEISGLGKTNMEVDTETGWLISGSSKVQMSGTMHVNAQGQSMVIPVESMVASETIAIE